MSPRKSFRYQTDPMEGHKVPMTSAGAVWGWGWGWGGGSSDKPSPAPHLWILGVGTGGPQVTGVDGGN